MARPDYVTSLHELWTAAIAPRAADAPTLVSTFAGCGGSSLGYHAAGFRELLAVEWEPHAAAHLRLNFPTVPVLEGDIATVDENTVTIPPEGLDVLDGSPPCQGFSLAGKRNVADPRNTLFMQFIRLAELWRPRVLIMENVPAMSRGRTRPIFLACMKEFANAGYRAEARILQGDRLGGASIRQRLYIIGVRADLNMAPAFPRPQYGYTFREAVADVSAGPVPCVNTTTANLATHVSAGKSASSLLDEYGKKASYFGTWRAGWDQPCRTVLKHNPMAGIFHPSENRVLTVPELKRIQGFPDEYQFTGKPEQIQDRIGNSVMPPMAYQVGLAVREHILDPLRA